MTSSGPSTYVIGTAGHVDHGKSTLVRALTDIDPDRLQEEKQREMTIDLGFAWLSLPSGRQASIIDVPGHERFVKNMLAGVGGIDAALLIIAADEGPMPQTEEHLDILNLLEIDRGLVVLTKIDMVEEEWRELVVEEIRERLAGSVLANSPIIPVSSISGDGIDQVRQEIDRVLGDTPPHTETGRPRLSIDRVFTVAGFGTVVTGTLLGGPLEIGQDLEILPDGIRTRVRGLQSHEQKVERALPGTRTAVNLTGVDVEHLDRGDLLTVPGWLEPTRLLDARVRMVENAPVILEQNDEVDFFVGASEITGRVTLLNDEKIEPGQNAWVQIRFPRPVVAVRGDRFIIRRPSPSETIGGGIIVDPHPRRHRRFRAEVIEQLEVLATGSPDEIVLQTIGATPRDVRTLVREINLPESDIHAALADLIERGDVLALRRGDEFTGKLVPSDFVMTASAYRSVVDEIARQVSDYHQRNPLRRGMGKEEIRSRLDIPARPFEEIIARAASEEQLGDEGDVVRLPEHAIQLTPDQRVIADRYLSALTANPYSPPSPTDFGLDAELTIALQETGEVVRVDENIVFSSERFADIRQQVLDLIDQNGDLSLAEFRDHFGTSRKYAQAVLEYLDDRRVTRRVGDKRVRYAAAS